MLVSDESPASRVIGVEGAKPIPYFSSEFWGEGRKPLLIFFASFGILFLPSPLEGSAMCEEFVISVASDGFLKIAHFVDGKFQYFWGLDGVLVTHAALA